MQSKILRIILVSFICFPLAGEESSSNLCAEGYIEEEGEYCVKNSVSYTHLTLPTTFGV